MPAMFGVESTLVLVYLMDFAGNFGWNLIKNHEYIYIYMLIYAGNLPFRVHC